MDLMDGSAFWQFTLGPAAVAPTGLIGKIRSPTMIGHPGHITGWLLFACMEVWRRWNT